MGYSGYLILIFQEEPNVRIHLKMWGIWLAFVWQIESKKVENDALEFPQMLV